MHRAAMCAVTLGVALICGSALGSSGNAIRVSVPARVMVTTAKHPHSYTVVVRGFARRPATAYLFIDYAGCARQFSVEYQRSPKKGRPHWPVDGTFHVTSSWSPNYPGIDHACAYLVSRRSGTLTASARASFQIEAH